MFSQIGAKYNSEKDMVTQEDGTIIWVTWAGI